MKFSKIVLLICVLALVLFFRFQQFYHSHPSLKDGQDVDLVTTLQAEPKFSNQGQKFSIKTPINQLISVTASAFPRYHYGQVIKIQGKLKAKTFDDGQTIFLLYHPKIIFQQDAENPLANAAKDIRNRTETIYDAALPPTSAHLLMGIVFGAKEQFSDEFWQDLQATGVLHVIAASGMNVTFVAAALLFTLGLFLQRRVALVLGSLGIIFYVFLVGFQPSILRASIMGLLAFGAGLLGKQNFAAVAVFVSGYCLLLYQPSYLFDVGFQLSFLATLGIIFMKPLLDGWFGKVGKLAEFGGETVSTTLAAELGTIPILFGTFGQLGLLSLLVNALLLWTVPILMIIGSVAAFVGLVFPLLGQLLVYSALPFLLFFELIVSYFGAKGWVMTLTHWSWTFSLGYYLLLAAIIFIKKPTQKGLSVEDSLALERH
ncbi:MAG: ComEC/Rec2 family competence protein [Candidatus Levyibacteriota bacterium]